MSWRSGVQLFEDIWPALRLRLPNATVRRQFLGRLLPVFVEWDASPEELADIDPEVRRVLAGLGEVADAPPVGETNGVAVCIRQLSRAEEKARVTAAQAIEHDVHQEDAARVAGKALRALVNALGDTSIRVRRAAAQSLASLLGDGFALAPAAQVKLHAALGDTDAVVRKRVELALHRLAKKKLQLKERGR